MRASNLKISRSILLALFLAVAVNSQEATSEPDKLYWFWSTECDGHMLRMEVAIDEALVYQTFVPLCHDTWAKRRLVDGKIRIVFEFGAEQPISWSGYTDDVQISPDGDIITGNIWLAGADPDQMIIGITFFSDALESILMNTIYLASPHKESFVEVAPNFVVRSTPTKSRREADPREPQESPNNALH